MSQLWRLVAVCTAVLARRQVALAVAAAGTATDPCRTKDYFRTSDIVSAAAGDVGCLGGRCFGRTARRLMAMKALRRIAHFEDSHSPAAAAAAAAYWRRLFPLVTWLLATAEGRAVA